MIAEFSETVTGAAVIRAYGLQERARVRLRDRIDGAYRARLRAAKYFAAMFPLGDFFGAIALAGDRRGVGVLRHRAGASTSARSSRSCS